MIMDERVIDFQNIFAHDWTMCKIFFENSKFLLLHIYKWTVLSPPPPFPISMLKITFFYAGKVCAVRIINIAIGGRGEIIMDERLIDFQNIFAQIVLIRREVFTKVYMCCEDFDKLATDFLMLFEYPMCLLKFLLKIGRRERWQPRGTGEWNYITNISVMRFNII